MCLVIKLKRSLGKRSDWDELARVKGKEAR